MSEQRTGSDRRSVRLGGRRAEDQHGTRSQYQRGCHCLPCRAANARYEAERATAKAKGQSLEAIDAAPAHAYLLALQSAGIGVRQAAALAQVSVRTVQRIRSGQSPQIRPDVAAAILAIRPALAHGCLATGKDSYTCRQLVSGLKAEGLHTTEIARRLGLHSGQLQFHYQRMRVRNVLKVRQLHRAIMDDAITA